MFFFELTVRSKDPVVGMGFSDHGETSNADFMVTWLDAAGERHVQVTPTYDKITCLILCMCK